MKNVLVFLLALLITILLTGCGKPGETPPEKVGAFEVTRLFTVDGITMYRFTDAATYRYFTTKGDVTWREGCGKNCYRDMEVPVHE